MNRPLFPRSRPLAVGAGLAAAAVVLTLSGGIAFGFWADRQAEGDGSAGQHALAEEIHAMIDAGLPEDDPKVVMLEDELATLRDLDGAIAVPDPGFDPAALEDLVAGSSRSAVPDPTEEWEYGEVDCEPIPGRLTVDDIAGASCFVEPQPDGSVRYVAVAPDGTELDARFAEPVTWPPADDRDLTAR